MLPDFCVLLNNFLWSLLISGLFPCYFSIIFVNQIKFMHFGRTLFVLLILSSWNASAQSDKFYPLRATGDIPADFTTFTIEKIEERQHNHQEEFEQLSRRNQRLFLRAVHQGIDEILRSGTVLFGDPVTEYVNTLGKKIIGDDESLKNIRFYTLKTNVVNAFSTNQGIIFVSQGLIAQVKNEAQLAFVLSHEIAHYIEKHVIIGFKENVELMNSKRSISEKIKRYSIYSKDKEYEADRIGIKLYNKAGYNLTDLFSVFDLLTFSYLPFETKVLTKDYFNSDKLFLPESFFKKDLPKVNAEEEYDDSRSTHPNIKSRKDQLSGEVNKYSTWDTLSMLTSMEEFNYARNLARLEQVRNNLYEFDYIGAMYNLYLLEDDFRDNIYFIRYRAQAWLGLLSFKISGRFTDISSSLNFIQGEQHQMHHVIRALNRRQLATLAIRNLYDIKNAYPDDEQINAIFNTAVRLLADDDRFKLKDFYDISYKEAIERFGPSVTPDNGEDNNPNKLNKARLAQERQRYGMSVDGKIADEDFFKFALVDVIQDKDFTRMYEKAVRERKEEKERIDARDALGKKQRNKLRKREFDDLLRSDVKNLILLEPRAIAVSRNESDVVVAEQLELKLKDAFESLTVDFMTVHKIGSKELKGATADFYNEKAVLMNTLMQLSEYEDLVLFPVDYEAVQAMRKKYKTDKVAFIILENYRRPALLSTAMITTLTTVPLFSFAAYRFMNEISFTVILFDLKTYKIEGISGYELNGNPTKTTIEALVYDMLKTISLPKANTNK
jgi:Zn-dependent protease with chaperone function